MASGVWKFSAPEDLENVEGACYVASDGQKLLPMRAGSLDDPKTYAVSFSAVYPLIAARDSERRLVAQKQELSRTISKTNRNVSSARQTLERDSLFSNNVCRRPDASLPTRPRDAVSPARARQLAERDILICMRERVGCDVGADEFVRQTGLPRISGVPLGYACGQFVQSGRCPVDEWTGLSDAVQGMLFSSAREENNWFARGVYGATLLFRFNEDLERLTRVYSRPYYTWQNRIQRAQNSAHNRYLSCQNNLDTIEAAPAILSNARNAQTRIDSYLSTARKIASDNRDVIWKGEATACEALTCAASGRRTFCGMPLPNPSGRRR